MRPTPPPSIEVLRKQLHNDTANASRQLADVRKGLDAIAAQLDRQRVERATINDGWIWAGTNESKLLRLLRAAELDEVSPGLFALPANTDTDTMKALWESVIDLRYLELPNADG